MEILAVGVNYRATPAEIRGKLAIGTNQLQESLLSLHKYVSQGIILCTCNRVEIYTVPEEESMEPASIRFLNLRANLSSVELSRYIYTYSGEAAVRHIFQVASGLDSMIIGEYEILGQVKHSLEEADKSHLVEFPLLELFHHAIRAGRRVRTQTGISRNALSISSVAVDSAVKSMGDIRTRKLVVIGAGEAGRLVAKASRERGVSQIAVVSRSQEKGTELASVLNGTWVPMENLRQELIGADIVITCSGAPHPILKSAMVAEVMNLRPKRPLFVIDIAVPPNAESQVKQINNVFLKNIDELLQTCDANLNQRLSEIEDANLIVDEEVAKFMAYWQELETRPVISALVRKAEDIRQAQLDLTLKKLHNLSDEEREHLEAMTRAIVQKLLHEPIWHLKNGNHQKEDYIRMVNELFQLDEKKTHEETYPYCQAGRGLVERG